MFAEFFYETSENGPTRRLHFGLTSNGRADLYGASCGISIQNDLLVNSLPVVIVSMYPMLVSLVGKWL